MLANNSLTACSLALQHNLMLKSNRHEGLNVIFTCFLESPLMTPLLKSKVKFEFTISLTQSFSVLFSSSIPTCSRENSTKMFVFDLLFRVNERTLLKPTVTVLKSISVGFIDKSPSFPPPTTLMSYFWNIFSSLSLIKVPDPGLKKPIFSFIGSEMLATWRGTENIYSLILVGVKLHMIFNSSFAFKSYLMGSKMMFSQYFSGTLNSNSSGIQALFLSASFCFWETPR